MADPGRSILICTYGSPGDLLPYLAVAVGLRERGWSVTVGAPAAYSERIRSAGVEAAPIRPDKPQHAPDPDLWDRIVAGRRRPGAIFEDMFLPGIRQSWEDTLAAARGKDAIVSHTLAFAAPIAAASLSIPWISGVVSPIAYFSRFDPPALGPDWAGPGLRAAGGAGAGLARSAMHLVLRRWSGEWRSIRREARLDEAGDPVSRQHSPLLALALFSPLLAAPQRDWPPAALVTGFPFMPDPFQPELPPELEGFLAAGSPPVVFTLGTTAVNDPGSFYEVSVEAARRAGVRAVLLVGPGAVGDRRQLPEEAIAVRYAPFGALFPRCAAIVHQAGIGTLAQAMRAGVPSLIVPYAHDQPDNAARAERLGIARVLGRREYRPDAAAAALSSVLRDESVARKSREAGQQVRLEDGAGVAAEAIVRALETVM